ncbi:hypothetical protein [uncultured Alistipes sp.]|uniref:hypothetical protein n=1 Tax=uncultured Alistipes sp. TaxID=538949 RepID=UPI0025D95AC3|nr:hypothetical protein [uncultured Alistipes sp.]
MKTIRQTYSVAIMQTLLPVIPGLYVLLFHPGTAMLTPQIMVSWALGINLLFILFGWSKLGWTRRERIETAWLLVLFAFLPWVGYWMLSAGGIVWSLWLQILFYCVLQAGFFVAIIQAPLWVDRLQQRRHEQRVLSGREKFESREEVIEALEDAERRQE